MNAAGSARLTDEIPAERAVFATLPREEIVEAIGASTTPELQLEVAQRSEDGEERATVSITWSRDELEKLLAQATSDSVVLTFDREELARAVADVEAHGLRERALVFTVAAVGALGIGAGLANAMPSYGPGESATVPAAAETMVTDASTGGYVTPAAASASDAMVTDASTGGYVAPAAASAADAMTTDASSAGGYAAAADASAADSLMTDASSAGGYSASEGASADRLLTDASSASGYAAAADGSAADSLRTDASSAGGYAAASEGSAADALLTDASSTGGYAVAADSSGAGSLLTDVSSGGGYAAPAPTSDSGGFIDVRSPDPTDAALAGGLGLAIAAAAFASRRTRIVRPA